MLAWSASTDNVGVVEYGLYASGLRVATSSDASATLTNLACGTSYLIAIDAADAAGNRSAQASSFFRTSACPSTNKPPSTPTGLKVTAATATSVSLAWTASTDDVAVSGLRALRRRPAHQPRRPPPAPTSRACSAARPTRWVSTRTTTPASAPPSPSSPPQPPPALPRRRRRPATGTVTQTIANGSTISGVVNWRAVYDGNGDGIEDDPGKIEFRVDGNLVLTEI